jgi:hypothetical protein
MDLRVCVIDCRKVEIGNDVNLSDLDRIVDLAEEHTVDELVHWSRAELGKHAADLLYYNNI